MLKIAEEIVHIMHNDYAGCLDKKGWDARTGCFFGKGEARSEPFIKGIS
ncbi:hypothetical protein [Sporosarcina sp. Te-1]|nr:hypothetical protein [Sporosarcina sp. Te-1]QTD39592.1 hypothetical protein J3U78_12090 [Sporosarcina sp. Te-1]